MPWTKACERKGRDQESDSGRGDIKGENINTYLKLNALECIISSDEEHHWPKDRGNKQDGPAEFGLDANGWRRPASRLLNSEVITVRRLRLDIHRQAISLVTSLTRGDRVLKKQIDENKQQEARLKQKRRKIKIKTTKSQPRLTRGNLFVTLKSEGKSFILTWDREFHW